MLNDYLGDFSSWLIENVVKMILGQHRVCRIRRFRIRENLKLSLVFFHHGFTLLGKGRRDLLEVRLCESLAGEHRDLN